MSNSLELLSGPSISEIQKKYEILSDIVTEYNGKVHGSQRDRDPKTCLIDLLVYYEVPFGKREEVKQRFNSHFVYSQQYYRRNLFYSFSHFLYLIILSNLFMKSF
jgi:hypothetical protein